MPQATTTVADEPVTACAWCTAPLGEEADHRPGRTVCPACGAATTDPWPSARTLEEAYAGFYRPAGGRFSLAGDALLRRSRGMLARRLDRIAPPGPVLDVGAGEGALLDALRHRGRMAVGLERNAQRPGVRAVEIEDLDEGGFAAIVFWHALEHLRAPGAAVGHAAARLRPGGVVVIAVPNAASLQARLFGDRWLALDLPRHLVHLPAPALLARLRAAGLVIERVSHLRGGQVVFGWLHGLVGTLPGHPHLYDAIRRPEARSRPVRPVRRGATLAAGTVLLPLALLGALLEAAVRRGGTVYVEARRA